MTDKIAKPIAASLVAIVITMAPHLLTAGELKVVLNEVSVINADQRVTIGDVATVSGGTQSDRQRIEQLDLETMDRTASVRQIAKRQIELRVLVDGYARSGFEVIGPKTVTVRCSCARQLREKLETLATAEISRQFGLDNQSVGVRMENDHQIKAAEARLAAADFSTTVLFQPQLPIGKTQIQFEFLSETGDRFLFAFDAQVIVSMEVALATRSIAKGTVVDADMIQVIKRPMVKREDFADGSDVIGRVAKRDIFRNDVVLSSDIEAIGRTELTPVVKRNDVLDVIIEVGSGQVRLKNARAMSQGAIGDTIVVLNTRTNIRLSATVVDRNLAKIPLLNGGR